MTSECEDASDGHSLFLVVSFYPLSYQKIKRYSQLFVWVSLTGELYIPGTQKSLFWRQNKGQTGSRYVCIIYFWISMEISFCYCTMISIARPCFHAAMATVDIAPTVEAALRPRRVAGAFADLGVFIKQHFPTWICLILFGNMTP